MSKMKGCYLCATRTKEDQCTVLKKQWYVHDVLKTHDSELRETDSDSHSTCSLVLSVENPIQAVQSCAFQPHNKMV